MGVLHKTNTKKRLHSLENARLRNESLDLHGACTREQTETPYSHRSQRIGYMVQVFLATY